jgi:hypothetical protein
MGTFVGPADSRIGFAVQAYADDVIFISKTSNGIRQMLEVLDQSDQSITRPRCSSDVFNASQIVS